MYKDKVKFYKSLKYRSPMSHHFSIDRAHQLDELIRHAISQSSLVARQNVQYRIEQEQVFLTGIVNSYYEKQLAQESIGRIQGVRQVHNRLNVEPVQNQVETVEIP
ncbi:BON domain protein [Gimesia panareensis]|uniref:BON domain protein n=1 Tax=Gimesia panareensis TaxID=2527978 RepID=A0A518FT14_9PLAN|nr:BON domain-containing protein [Gimesia panareensis]QDV19484.1 BON domain protein [Gimesia panareensis]